MSHPARNAIVLRIPLPPEDYVPLVLATKCHSCLGAGVVAAFKSACGICGGVGLNLTTEGQKILDLVQAFEGGS